MKFIQDNYNEVTVEKYYSLGVRKDVISLDIAHSDADNVYFLKDEAIRFANYILELTKDMD